MTQSWADKIKSALEGLVDGADARARLASAASLASLRRQLADRRLDAELAHIDQPWRVPFTLAPIAALIQLAEALVLLAQSFSDAEAEAHPDRPTMMSALTHGRILELLEPVDTLQGDISGVLADPNRRPVLPLPRLIRPFAHTGAGLMAERIPLPYARGLLAGALSLAGATQILSADYGAFFQHPSAPPWLSAGFATIGGDLAAAQTRLDAVQLRAAPILRQPQPDEAALRTLVVDLWDLTNSYLMAAQQISAPALLPGARPLPGAAASGNQGQATPARTGSIPLASPSNPQSPVAGPSHPSPAAETPRPIVAMPEIGGAPGRAAARTNSAAVRMPEIGLSSPAGVPAHVTPPPPATVRMPEIGAAHPAAGALATPRSMPAIDPSHPTAPPAVRPEQVRMPHIETGSATVLPGATSPHPTTDARSGSSLVVDPSSSSAPPTVTAGPHAPARRVEPKDRWLLSAQAARYRLRAAGQENQAEAQLAAFWKARRWMLSSAESRYLDTVTQAARSGTIVQSGRSLADCPFAPIYRVGNAPLQILDRSLRPGTLFSYDFRAGGKGLLIDLSPQSGVADAP
jgi:hypothetical protein